MKMQQISIFLENSAGRLAEVTRVLKEANINLRAIMIADTADFGILRIITNDPAKALAVLKDAKFTTRTTDVLAVEVPDVIGSLNDILALFQATKLNIEYLYASFECTADRTIIIFKVEDIDRALKVADENNLQCINNF